MVDIHYSPMWQARVTGRRPHHLGVNVILMYLWSIVFALALASAAVILRVISVGRPSPIPVALQNY
jgi:hypothetical protein